MGKYHINKCLEQEEKTMTRGCQEIIKLTDRINEIERNKQNNTNQSNEELALRENQYID